jgi:cytochrome c-type biogenesis protein CcmH
LRQNPRDLEGWTRLVRSYQVLGRTDAARDALQRGLAALGEDSQDGKKLAEFSKTLDVPGTK